MVLFLYFLAFCLLGYSSYKLYGIVGLLRGLNKQEKQLIIDIRDNLKHIAEDVDLQKGLIDSKAVQDYLTFKIKDMNKKILTSEILDEKTRLSLMLAVMRAATHIVMAKTVNRDEFETAKEVKKEVEETIDIFSVPGVSNNKLEIALYGTLFVGSFYIVVKYFSFILTSIRFMF